VREEEGDGRVGRKVEWAGWPLNRKLKKFFSEKIRFLKIPRLWKFVGGDLGGILI
jgi:hypothetical protein